MLNTQKLLYILPDTALIAELLPNKKPSTFSVQSFLQINGTFIEDQKLVGESILKLFHKLDQDEYHLILPDFLFTNTIVTIAETADSKIKQQLTDEVLPKLKLNPDTHHLDTTILTEHGNETKVQLSALDKSLLEPIQISARDTQVKIKGISPLSWSLKSLISLEPSISLVQISSRLYLAFHYIGVDQTFHYEVGETEEAADKIAALRTDEPSIQTVYLLSNQEVEAELKERVGETLPIQQLADKPDSSKMPAFIQKLIESGMRTLSIPDYPVPAFELGKAPAGAKIEVSTPEPVKDDEATATETDDVDETIEETELPKPGVISETAVSTSDIEDHTEVEDGAELEPVPATATADLDEDLDADLDDKSGVVSPIAAADAAEAAEDDAIEELLASLKSEADSDDVSEPTPKETPQPDTRPDLSPGKAELAAEAAKPAQDKAEEPARSAPKKIIKNKNKTSTMLKMVFVTLAVFFATVGVGIGIGLGVLQLTQPGSETESPIVEVTPSPEPSPSPSPSPSPEINLSDLSVLVVNATTQPGYAGQTADALEAAGVGSVTAGNARGDYEDGMYLLVTEQDPALAAALEEATDLDLRVTTDKEAEDPSAQYDAVIVLAE